MMASSTSAADGDGHAAERHGVDRGPQRVEDEDDGEQRQRDGASA